jgi:hypothetical protein
MVEEEASPYRQFVNLFEELKFTFGDSPDMIPPRTFGEDRRPLVVRRLEQLVSDHDLIRKMWNVRPEMYVPVDFKELFSDYLKRWDRSVRTLPFLFDHPVPALEELPDQLLRRGETKIRFPVLPADPRWEDTYDPALSHGHQIINAIEQYVYERIDDEYRDTHVTNMFGIFLGYIDFLREEVSLDLEGIERRWRLIPKFMLPEHVSRSDVSAVVAGRDSPLYRLIDSATRSFLFGCIEPSLVMCRAILEKTLLEFYADKARTGERPELKRLIKHVFDRHGDTLPKSWRDIMYHIRERGNAIVHNIGSSGPAVLDGEREIVRFLVFLDELIRKAPTVHS